MIKVSITKSDVNKNYVFHHIAQHKTHIIHDKFLPKTFSLYLSPVFISNFQFLGNTKVEKQAEHTPKKRSDKSKDKVFYNKKARQYLIKGLFVLGYNKF